MAGHWYTNSGEPMHEVPNASARKAGNPTAMRDTTLRDARKLNLNPSVTTVTKILDKGETLLEWQVKQALYSAAVHPDGWPEFDLDESGMLSEKDPIFVKWAKDCRMDAVRQVTVKADRGSILHDAMMRAHHSYDTIQPQYYAHVDGMMEMLERNFGKRHWIAEKCFAHRLGFGGSVDLHSYAVGKPGDPGYLPPIILDYKFKDFDESRDAEYFVYDEHRMQLGGYRVGLQLQGAKLYNAFGSITHPGLVLLHSHSDEDAIKGEKMFLLALQLWQVKNDYAPAWRKEAA